MILRQTTEIIPSEHNWSGLLNINKQSYPSDYFAQFQANFLDEAYKGESLQLRLQC